MNKRLLHVLVVFLLLCIWHNPVLASGEVTLTWTQTIAVSSISDAYYTTDDGSQAFIAGGLTRIPVGADVYITIQPIDSESMLTGVYVAFDGEKLPLERSDGQAGDSTYHFVMRSCESGQAELIVECDKTYSISFTEGFKTEPDGSFSDGTGSLCLMNENGEIIDHAAEGENVIVKVIPGAEYALSMDSMCMLDASGNQTALSSNEAGDYCFDMPGEPVTLTAHFEEAAMINMPEGVAYTVSGDYAYQQPPRALAGTNVEISISPKETDKRIRAGSQGITYNGTGSTEYIDEQDADTGAFSVDITIPEGGITLLADVGTLCNIECASDVNVYASDQKSTITSCCEGEEIYVTVNLPEGYGLVNGVVNVSSAGKTVATVQKSLGGYDATNNSVLLIAPSGSIRLEADVSPLFSLGSAQTHGMGVVRTYPAGNAAVGSTVKVALLPCEGWQIKDGSLAVYAQGTHTKIAEVVDDSFVMPESNCEISAEFEPMQQSVELIGSECFSLNADYSLSAAGAVGMTVSDGAPAGALVNVYITSESGCSIEGIYLYDNESGKTELLSNEYQASFIMPANGVSVYAVCENEIHASPAIAADVGATEKSQFPYEALIKTEDRNLNLREDSSPDAHVIDKYPSGTSVTVDKLSDDGQWAYVTVTEDGKTGWMNIEYLDALSTDAQIEISINLPDIRVHRPYLVEKTASDDDEYVFKHIILL